MLYPTDCPEELYFAQVKMKDYFEEFERYSYGDLESLIENITTRNKKGQIELKTKKLLDSPRLLAALEILERDLGKTYTLNRFGFREPRTLLEKLGFYFFGNLPRLED